MNANANQQTVATSLTGVNLIALDADDAWAQVPASLLGAAVQRYSHKTANYTILSTEVGTLFTNLGASSTITFTLPAAALGMHFRFQVRASSGTSWQLRVAPAGSDILETCAVPRVAGTANDYLWADGLGESLHLVCMEAGKWAALTYDGTWSLQAV